MELHASAYMVFMHSQKEEHDITPNTGSELEKQAATGLLRERRASHRHRKPKPSAQGHRARLDRDKT